MHRQNTVTHKNYIQTLQSLQKDDEKEKHIKRYLNNKKKKCFIVSTLF